MPDLHPDLHSSMDMSVHVVYAVFCDRIQNQRLEISDNDSEIKI